MKHAAIATVAELRIGTPRSFWRSSPGFPIWTDRRPRDGVHRAAHPVGQLVNTSQHVTNSHPGEPGGLCGPVPPSLATPTVSFKDTAAASPSRCSFRPLPVRCSRSGRGPRESLDAPENLPKESRRQVALRQLQDEVSGMADEPPAGLEQPLLQARQRPALDGERQDQPSQEIAEVVSDDPEEQPDLVGSEPVAGEPRPVGRGLALLDPLLRRPAPVVEADHGPVGPGQGGHDEADPREQLAEVMLDLGDHPPRPVPRRGPILKAPVAHQRGVARSAAWPGEKVLDGPLQDIGADDQGLSPGSVPVNDGEELLIPPVSIVDVARPKRGGQAVAVLVEDEEGMVADGLEVRGWSAPEAGRDAIEGAAGVVPRRGGHSWRFERSESISGSRCSISRPSTRAAKCWSGGNCRG